MSSLGSRGFCDDTRCRACVSKPDKHGLMHKALGKALDEIHNPGFNRTCGFDIVGHIEEIRKLAAKVAPDEF